MNDKLTDKTPIEQFFDHNVKQFRIKTGQFLARLSREDLSRGLSEPGKHKFYRLEMEYKDALVKYEEMKKKLELSRISDSISLRNLNLELDLYKWHQLYNMIFFTSPDPTREISLDEANGFPEERTFVAEFIDNLVGFIYLTIEKETIGGDGQVVSAGAVAGIGVLAKHRGKKIGLKLLMHAIDFFRDKDVDKLICEVYEKNEASLAMFKGMGMEIAGVMILEDEQPNKLPDPI